jgi:tetratricopeptide (TPR) repeat protein
MRICAASSELKRFDEAAGEFESSLEINPKYLEAWQNLGLVRQHQGRFSEAASCFEHVLSLDETHQAAKDGLASLAKAA